MDGSSRIIALLRNMGVTCYAGVTGGNILRFTTQLEPFRSAAGADDCRPDADDKRPFLLTLNEFVAGFVPVGHYLATGRIAAAVATAGGATKLASCGISDAKMHNIPAVYLVGLNAGTSAGLAPLQDVTPEGMNIVAQLRAEIGDGCLLIEDIHDIDTQLEKARRLLSDSRPVVLAVAPEALNSAMPTCDIPESELDSLGPQVDASALERHLRSLVRGRRVVLFVGEEVARCPGVASLTKRLAHTFGAPTVWSQSAASAVSADSPFAYGCIGFGGNDRANELWQSLTSDDVVIALGLDPGEYVLGMERIKAGTVVHITAWQNPYGSRNGGFAHRCAGEYRLVRGDIGQVLAAVLPLLEQGPVDSIRQPYAPTNLNDPTPPYTPAPGSVDFAELLLRLHRQWRPGTLVFDDVCLAYKDRQFVTQRPSGAVQVFSAHQASTMGSAFGHAVGAKIASPHTDVFCFTGDGCFRLYGGALADVADLGIVVFVIDNGGYGIIQQGYDKIAPEVGRDRFHSVLPPLDFVAAAIAYRWKAWRLEPDLSNLDEVLADCRTPNGRSVLVSVPVDTDQTLGHNPRVRHLGARDETSPPNATSERGTEASRNDTGP
ncbi:thiamine pyrophosphate-dependent enzyme [Micromonospora olivasterospora]|uniref:Acetolactate synthase-1/2/3 large subunit n=1 Tax=Micromonospora olivasterospora TaxID=1880 RepID=A0A562I9T2_MICOL|nr:thiamine pyrophosphate-dependent enzyme [Micromonospora olivasterospora]TWH67810.1 acetolactate synthase-1/2/3 large subunit [Micromonospora olivasterospora]